MARMSIDDSSLRDHRVLLLAKLCGWNRRETIGCLLDIWALCYDRVSEYLPEAGIDVTSEHDGFARKLIEVGLASPGKGGMVRISGAKQRIEYLRKQQASGRLGGLKSAERRTKRPKARLSNPSSDPQATLNLTLEGSVNPPDPVPDSDSSPVPVPDLDPVPDAPTPEISPPRSRPWTPTLVESLDEREKLKREIVAAIGPKHAMAFARVKSQLGSTALGPSVGDRFDQLRELLDEIPSLDGMQERCEYALAIQEAEALQKRTMQYFGSSMWKRATFEKALTFELDDVNGMRATATDGPTALAMAELRELERKEREGGST